MEIWNYAVAGYIYYSTFQGQFLFLNNIAYLLKQRSFCKKCIRTSNFEETLDLIFKTVFSFSILLEFNVHGMKEGTWVFVH